MTAHRVAIRAAIRAQGRGRPVRADRREGAMIAAAMDTCRPNGHITAPSR
jgi:hypothetical protein